MYTHRRTATAHSTQRTPGCRFAIDRTPLQRMLMAAVLHSHLSRGGPGGPPAIPGGLVPPRVADDAKADAYAEFHSVGRLPTDLFEDSTAAVSGPGWHGETAAGRVTHVEARAVVDYQKGFKVVRASVTPIVCTRHGHAAAVLCYSRSLVRHAAPSLRFLSLPPSVYTCNASSGSAPRRESGCRCQAGRCCGRLLCDESTR